jgi:hypothetical protein
MATAAAPASTALRERDRLIFGQRRKEREVQKGTKLAVSSFQRRCIGPAFRGLSLVCGTDIQVLSNRSPSSGHINLRAIADPLKNVDDMIKRPIGFDAMSISRRSRLNG